MARNSTEAARMLREVHRQLDVLYEEYYQKGTVPGIFEAKAIFDNLMAAWDTYRRNR